MATYYPADYHGQSSRGAVQNLRHDVRLRGLSRRLTRPGAIVDYGCGNGGFLVHVSRKIHDRLLIGYEIAERPERQSLEGGRVTIIRGSLDDLLRELPECAVVTMNHVIEHLPDPLAVVSSLVAKVGPEGWFEGQTPAAQSLEHAVFGRHWSGFHAPRHTVVFSPRGLRSFLERVALTEIQVERGFNPAGIAVSLASLFSGRDQGIHRQGPLWMLWLGIATALSAIDFLSGRSGMLNFAARKRP